TPGRVRPQTDAVAEVCSCQDGIAQLQVTDAALDQGPVMARVEQQSAVQPLDCARVSFRRSLAGLGNRELVMIARAGGSHSPGFFLRLPGLLGVFEQPEVGGPISPQRRGGVK